MSKTKKLIETCYPEDDVQPVSPREQTSSEVNINELKASVLSNLDELARIANQLSYSVRKLYDGITEELEKA